MRYTIKKLDDVTWSVYENDDELPIYSSTSKEGAKIFVRYKEHPEISDATCGMTQMLASIREDLQKLPEETEKLAEAKSAVDAAEDALLELYMHYGGR